MVRAHLTIQLGLWVQVHPNKTTEIVHDNIIKTRKEEREIAFLNAYLISRSSFCTRAARQPLQNVPGKSKSKAFQEAQYLNEMPHVGAFRKLLAC